MNSKLNEYRKLNISVCQNTERSKRRGEVQGERDVSKKKENNIYEWYVTYFNFTSKLKKKNPKNPHFSNQSILQKTEMPEIGKI